MATTTTPMLSDADLAALVEDCGSADPIAIDYCLCSAWGGIDDCAVEGGTPFAPAITGPWRGSLWSRFKRWIAYF